ncbi:MAG: YaaA family protein [Erysipelotrichia bacterium]|nr:YaaA family protein [Erysipelotrichia bacterium]NCC54050.1 YaaA family protein [Erysipelotrichia bacterium]
MYFIISPTKELREKTVKGEALMPLFIERSKLLIKQLRQFSVAELMDTMKINEKIAQLNVERYRKWCTDKQGQSAIAMYYGLQYKQLSLDTYNEQQLAFMNEHIRILSGLYGVLRPFDRIYPYRLEMNYKPLDLYSFWQEDVTNYFKGHCVVNVASNEYRDVLNIKTHDIIFKVEKNGKLLTQSTQVKMARGKFIHYVITHQINDLTGLKQFNEDGYAYCETLSDEEHYVFVKSEGHKR